MKKSLALLAIIAFPALSQPVNIDTGNTGTGKTVHQTSPTLTGTPLAPTAALGTNTTQLATTAFVLANGGTPTWSSMTGQAIVTSYPALAADTLPSATIIHGQDAWSQATTAPKQTGANLVLAGGIGQRLITFVTPNSTGGKIVTFTANGTATNLTEGTNFNCNTLTTSQCATNLAAAIVANGTLTALMTPTANVSAGLVHLDPKAGLYSLVVTDDAGAAITETSGTDGATTINSGGDIVLNQGTSGKIKINSDAAHGYNGYIQTDNNLYIQLGSVSYALSPSLLIPPSTTVDLGNVSYPWRSFSLGRATYGNGVGTTLTDNSATIFAKVGIVSGATWGGDIVYKLEGKDATDFVTISGRVTVSAINKAGTITCAVSAVRETAGLGSGGATITNTGFTCADAGSNVLNILSNVTTSLADTANWPKIYARVDSMNDSTFIYTPQ